MKMNKKTQKKEEMERGRKNTCARACSIDVIVVIESVPMGEVVVAPVVGQRSPLLLLLP